MQPWFGGRLPNFLGDEFRFLSFGFQAQSTGQHHRWIEQSPSLTAAFRTFRAGVAIRDRSPHFIGGAFVGGTGEFVNGHGLEWIKKKESIVRLTDKMQVLFNQQNTDTRLFNDALYSPLDIKDDRWLNTLSGLIQ